MDTTTTTIKKKITATSVLQKKDSEKKKKKNDPITHETIVNSYEESITKLIHQLFKSEEERAWIVDEILHKGPPHKQILTSLLLQNISDHIFAKQIAIGKKFKLKNGFKITTGKPDEQYSIPIDYTGTLDKATTATTIAFIGKAPVHESIAYLLTMQAIDWMTSVK